MDNYTKIADDISPIALIAADVLDKVSKKVARLIDQAIDDALVNRDDDIFPDVRDAVLANLADAIR